MKARTWVTIAVAATPAILLLIMCGSMYHSYRDRYNVYETPDAQGQDKTWFVEAFMPGVDVNDVRSLTFARSGGREPPYVARLELTSNGMMTLRATVKYVATSTLNEGSYSHMGGNQPGDARDIESKMAWWTMNDAQTHEILYLHWSGDHTAQFYIPTSGAPIYVEAIID